MRSCVRRSAAVPSSPWMKPAGAWTRICSGSGPMSRPETTVYAIQPGRGLAQAAQVIGLDYRRRAAARRLAVVSVFQGGAASDLSGPSAAPLSRAPAGLSRTTRLSAPSKPCCRRPSRRATPTGRGDVSAHGLAVARGHYLARLGRSAGTHAQSARRRSAGFNSTSSSNSPPSSVSSLTRRSTPPIGAPNTPCVRPSSPARCAAAGIEPVHGAESQQILTSVLRTADQRGLSQLPTPKLKSFEERDVRPTNELVDKTFTQWFDGFQLGSWELEVGS